MNQALLMSYTVGSLLGPTLTAMLMQNFSDNLLFIMIASVSFIPADAAAQKRAPSYAGGARLIFQEHSQGTSPGYGLMRRKKRIN